MKDDDKMWVGLALGGLVVWTTFLIAALQGC